MEIKTEISNLAYKLDNQISSEEDIDFQLNVLERAIKEFKHKKEKWRLRNIQI